MPPVPHPTYCDTCMERMLCIAFNNPPQCTEHECKKCYARRWFEKIFGPPNVKWKAKGLNFFITGEKPLEPNKDRKAMWTVLNPGEEDVS